MTRALGTFFLLLVSSISSAATAVDNKPLYGGSIVIANDKNVDGLNPLSINIRRTNNHHLFSLVLEGLVGVDRNENLLPSLADSWQVSPDGTSYTFRIRRGVKFHDGGELTSRDVKWTFDKLLDPKMKNPQRSTFLIVRSVESKGPFEVRFQLERPFAPFLGKLVSENAPIVPADSLPGLASHPIGTGPFCFVSSVGGGEIRLRRFKDYWQKGIPYLDEVIYRPVTDETTRLVALRSGDAHAANYIPVQSADRLIRAKDQTIRFYFLPIGLKWILLNNRKPPFDDRRVRRALAYAIDKKEIIEALTLGYGEVTNQRYPKGHAWRVDVPDHPQDLENAKSLLRQAGYGEGLHLEASTHPGNLPETVIIQSQLKKIGVELKVVSMDYVQQTKLLETRNYTLATGGAGIGTDPDSFYKRRFHSEENWDLGYQNPVMDRLLIEAQVNSDEKARKAIYKKVVEIIQEEVPAIFVGLTPTIIGATAKLKGFEPSFFGGYNFATGGVSRAWIER
jgi:peptide/nickel transport system substrate-binding protein